MTGGGVTSPARLGLSALPALAGRPGVRVPDYDVAALEVGIVHLGVGAFHRAHQAIYTEDCLGAGRWGICAYSQRSAAAVRALAPQDGLYTVLSQGPDSLREARVVGALREVRSAPDDPMDVASRIADPHITVITLTVTEKGYRAAAEGRLDLADEAVQADVAGFGVPGYRARTVVGQLAGGLDLRRLRGAGPVSVLSCDNVSGNGAALRGLVADFCEASRTGDGLASWIQTDVAFPSSVVDRIVPAADDGDRAEAQRMLGYADAAAVTAEPFRQWVIEDRFAAARPAWESAGAVLTADVGPYEAMKLRLLNATHSLVAYLGALAGHATIADAMTDPAIAEAARSLMAVDAAPTLTAPAGMGIGIGGYQDLVLRRFADPALRHRCAQVAADGSAKLPIRLLGTIRDRLAAGGEPYWAALAVAAWMVYVAQGGGSDPLAEELKRAVAGRATASGIVEGLLAVREVFPEALAGDLVFRRLLRSHVGRLLA